jgi:thermitase
VSDGLPRSISLLAAVDYARSRGTVVVAAAGNLDDWYGVYPAAYGRSFVGAADPRQEPAMRTSAFGPFLDITAPGLMVTAELGGLSSSLGAWPPPSR